MVSKVFEHPFDLCKVRLQTQVLDHTARFAGPLDCLSQTWRNEGIRGLYRVRLNLARHRPADRANACRENVAGPARARLRRDA